MADRYLARELVAPFFVGVFGFLLIQMSGVLMNLLRFVMDRDGTVEQVFRILAYRAPQFVVFALPVAVLFGVSLGINRMSRENEITVLRLSGMPIYRIAVPLLTVATLVAGVSFYINETVAPAMNRKAALAEYDLFFKVRPVRVRSDVFFHAGPYAFYVGDMQKTVDSRDPDRTVLHLYRVMVYQMRGGGYPVLFTADEATARGTRWTLLRGVRRELDARGFTMNEVSFPRYTFDIDRAAGFLWTAAETPNEMSAMALARAIREGERAGSPDVRNWKVDYYNKFALPFASVVLALVSLPLAIRFGRGGGFAGVLIALALFFLYVQGYVIFKQLGSSVLSPMLAAWTPNAVFGLVGLFLLWREE